jgi:hypothetical protein
MGESVKVVELLPSETDDLKKLQAALEAALEAARAASTAANSASDAYSNTIQALAERYGLYSKQTMVDGECRHLVVL